ncbi:frizzled-5-like [Octopus vulgaris]|uniref:Frizzled-5-like n=2 Tax=Octopus TaxID=6643 RepID=A0AA36F7J7_OCTVU|nr:frizzled-5-like [Octopus sinensis]CAI9727220.1 frizzled-5-like [Octopus vulgaris]
MKQKCNLRTSALVFLTLLSFVVEGKEEEEKRKCEEITVPMCRDIGYNMTYMPNQFNQETQEEAGLEVHQFWPLVKIQCSPDLRFFLCSLYLPICMENYKKPLPPCRSVCERAKAGCAPVMLVYSFVWPEHMNCDELPEFGSKPLCMDMNVTDRPSPPTKPHYLLPTDRSYNPFGETKPWHFNKQNNPYYKSKNSLSKHNIETSTKKCSCECKPPLVQPDNRNDAYYYNRITTGKIKKCAINCYGPYFGPNERTFANFWIGLWSILCCISTATTISTFLIDMQRFRYPERPIIFLSACYFMVSIGYIMRLIVGHEKVACDGNMIRYSTTGPAMCTVVFLLIYFFGMASSIWWVILSFTWFLAAGLKWAEEAIASYSQYFHLAAWLIPSVKSIAVLAMSSVDGDSVGGICYVGNQNLENLRGFVLAPLFVYLVLGTSFLFGGFVSLFRIRNAIKRQGRAKTEKLEKLMIRIGVFSFLYTVPATIVIAIYFYEQHMRSVWETDFTCSCGGYQHKPDFSVFMLKYFMCLVVGITSGFWIWTGKTLDSWKRFYGKICQRHSYNTSSRMKYTNPSYQMTKPQPMDHV